MHAFAMKQGRQGANVCFRDEGGELMAFRGATYALHDGYLLARHRWKLKAAYDSEISILNVKLNSKSIVHCYSVISNLCVIH